MAVGHTVLFAVFSLLVSPSGATSFTTALQATTTAQVTATVAETTAAGTTTFSNPSCSDVLVNIKGLGGEMTIGGNPDPDIDPTHVTMNLLSLVELDDAGVANRTANLSHTTFAFKTTTWQKDFYQDLPALSFSLSAILVDIANVTVQVYVVGEAGVVDNNTQHVERCSVKVKIQIDGWPFSKAGNMLHLSFTTHAAGGTGSVHQVPETVGEYELNPNAKLFLSHKVMYDDLWQDLPSDVSFVSATRMFGVGFNQAARIVYAPTIYLDPLPYFLSGDKFYILANLTLIGAPLEEYTAPMREMIKDTIWDNVLPKFRHRSPIDIFSVHSVSSRRRQRASDSIRVDLRLVTYESHAKQIADSITAATNTGRLVASLRQGGLVNVDAVSVAMDMERVAPPPVEWDRAARLATTPTCVLVSAVTLSLLVFGPLF